MIKATDLRVGNLILPNARTEEYVTVTDIDEDGNIGTTAFFWDGKGTSGTVSESAQGVLLTPEWLGRLDIEMHDGLYKFRHTAFFLRCREGNAVDIAIEDLNGNKLYIRYKMTFLHELQNIYYWLMRGEELTIKEPA